MPDHVSVAVAKQLHEFGIVVESYWNWCATCLANGTPQIYEPGMASYHDFGYHAPSCGELIVALRQVYPVLAIELSFDADGTHGELDGLACYASADTPQDVLGLLFLQVRGRHP